MALTFDDLPGAAGGHDLGRLVDMNRRVLAALQAERAPALGLVNEQRLHVAGERDRRVAILESWLDAGLLLGNHTFSHQDLDKIPLARFQDEIIKGEVITRALLEPRQLPLRWFRHPFTHGGATLEVKQAVDAFLAARGYAVIPFTIEHSDWMFAGIYESARSKGDRERMRTLKQAYLAHFEQMCAFFEKLSLDVLGREVPQILLTHVNSLNADALPELLAQLRRRGYRFVTVDEALADPAYAAPDRWVGRNGPSWLHRWAAAKGLPSRQREEPEVPPEIARVFRERMERHRAREAASSGTSATSPAGRPRP